MSEPTKWLSDSPPAVLNGRLGEYEQLLNTLTEHAGFRVLAADPLSGTSALIRAAASEVPSALVVDARDASDVIDLAQAILDAAIKQYFPDAYPWWLTGNHTIEGADKAALLLLRSLRSQSFVADDLRRRKITPGRALEAAVGFAVERARGPLSIVMDHFGLFASALGGKESPQLLGTLRALSQEHRDLDFLVVEHPDGAAAAALADEAHPLFHFGQVMRFRRPIPEQIVESLMITRPVTNVRGDLLRAAAELAAGVPSLTWRIVELSDSSTADPQAAAFAGWRTLRHLCEPSTAQQWDMLRAAHPLAQWAIALIAAGRGPYQSPANSKRVTDALQHLRRLGAAWQPEPRRWAVADPLLAAWAREHQPLWANQLGVNLTAAPQQ